MLTATPTYYLHVGPPKTGTTFIQSMLAEHCEALADAGVLYPQFRPHWRFLAALDGRDNHRYRGRTYDAAGKWQRFVDRTREFDGNVVFSHELLGVPHEQHEPTALRALRDYETHIVLTARDPARQIPSGWQQQLRHNKTTTFEEFLRGVEAPPGSSKPPRRLRGQRMDYILDRWSAYVAPERIHVVTLPPAGADQTLLWRRFCSVIGADARDYPVTESTRPNTSLGIAQIEHLRLVNEAIGDRLTDAEYARLVRRLYTTDLLPRTSQSARPALPESAHPVADRLAERWITAIERHGVDVVGDIDDLRPRKPTGESPDAWTSDEVMRIGAEATAELLIAYAERDRARDRDT